LAVAAARNAPRSSRSCAPARQVKFSLAAYSYRDLLNASAQLTLEDFLGDCAKMGSKAPS